MKIILMPCFAIRDTFCYVLYGKEMITLAPRKSFDILALYKSDYY